MLPSDFVPWSTLALLSSEVCGPFLRIIVLNTENKIYKIKIISFK